MILKSVKSQHSREVNLIEIVFVHIRIYISLVELKILSWDPSQTRYAIRDNTQGSRLLAIQV